jgi:hypothetical protein
MPTRCPVTGEPLEVTRLECPKSGVAIEGRFTPNEFARLSAENLELLRLFLRVRGNLKDVERILGVSYPTVRGRFDALLRDLGFEGPPETQEVRSERTDILGLLERGEVTAEEAAKRLRALKR